MRKNGHVWIVIGAAVVIVACVALAGKYLGTPTGTVSDNGTSTPAVSVEVATATAPVITMSALAPSSAVLVKVSSAPSSKPFANGSFAFAYPSGWTLGSAVPISINNFGASSWQGGLVPSGGVEMSVATTTLYGSLADMANYEFLNMTGVTTGTVTVSGASCIERYGRMTTNGGILSQNEAVYCPRGYEVWKIYFSYRAGDPQAANFKGIFRDILASFKLLP